ncbi:MAG: hypothetical protein KGH57_01260 [Candidatus Micrarchaeota archaeon]|nr:hypothetical protein [Candidatus Micrarchaeota archaeon]
MAATKATDETKGLEGQLNVMLNHEGAWARTQVIRPDQIAHSDRESLTSLLLIRRGIEDDYLPHSVGRKMVIGASLLLEDSGKPDKVVAGIKQTDEGDSLHVYLAFFYSKEKYDRFVDSYGGMVREELIGYPGLESKAFRAVVVGPFEFKREITGDSATDAIDGLIIGIKKGASESLQAEAEVEILS